MLSGAGNDYFDFYGSELSAGSPNQNNDFGSAAGNTDHIFLIDVAPGAVTFTPLDTGTNINVATNNGTATIFAANANITNVQNQTSFF